MFIKKFKKYIRIYLVLGKEIYKYSGSIKNERVFIKINEGRGVGITG